MTKLSPKSNIHLIIDPRHSGLSGDMLLSACTDILGNKVEMNSFLKDLTEKYSVQGSVELIADKENVIESSYLQNELDYEKTFTCAELIDAVEQQSKLNFSEETKIFAKLSLYLLLIVESQIHGIDNDLVELHYNGENQSQSRKRMVIELEKRIKENDLLEKLKLHELSTFDTIVDILGVSYQMEKGGWLKNTVFAYPVNVGGGQVSFSHGRFQVPAPATLELLKLGRLHWFETKGGELATPTGIALLVALLPETLKELPERVVMRIGYGSGTKKLEDRPNILRLMEIQLKDSSMNTLKETSAKELSWHTEPIIMLETDVDDVTPEHISGVIEQINEINGVLDVVQYPFFGKKSRLGTVLRMLMREAQVDAVKEILHRDLGTLGVRETKITRSVLSREVTEKNVLIGENQYNLRIKKRFIDGKWEILKPEYDDVRMIAKKESMTLREVMKRINQQLFTGFDGQ